MKNEILWYRLPWAEKAKMEDVIKLIASKNLTKLSINQLIEKLEDNQAADWIEVLEKYNSIPSIKNMDTSQILVRAEGVRGKFEQRGYPQLKDREFEPRELLSLIILCYSNLNLIGPKLCKALNDNNEAAIKKEILENSARVGDRVAPWASNLRLANYALYANDTTVLLPVDMTNRVQRETLANDKYNVTMIDEQFGFTVVVNCIDREVCSRSKRATSETKPHDALLGIPIEEAPDSDEDDLNISTLNIPASGFNQTGQGRFPLISSESETLPEPFPLQASNAVNTNNLNGMVVGGLALFHIVKNTPVAAVVRNIGKDLATASKHVGSFFSRNNSECLEEIDQKTALILPIVKP